MAEVFDRFFQEGDLPERLNHPDRTVRLGALRELDDLWGGLDASSLPDAEGEVNNHIHTAYSFSPYFPARAAFEARRAGLLAAGSVDHDSVAAAEEMIEACRVMGMGSTVGYEIRVSFADTPLGDRTLNNPDSRGIAYIVVHGVPHCCLDKTARFLAPINRARTRRNRLQVEALNGLLRGSGLEPLDFDMDVIPLSCAAEGGAVTERHILFALALRMTGAWGRGEALVKALEERFGMTLSGRAGAFLLDRENPHYLYDLLGVLKGRFLPKFFIQPSAEECLPVAEAVRFANSIGAIPSYSYLGDVGESPTGDKKAQKFEDDFLEELVVLVKQLGFKAITYMPPRNSREQLLRLMGLCREQGLMEISGVDINSSRQSFNCPEIRQEEFRHLLDTTWALIAHEHLASADRRLGLFSPENPVAERPLEERIGVYAGLGRGMDCRRPDSVLELATRGVFRDFLEER